MLGGTNSTWLSPGKHPVSALFEFAQAVGARGDGGGARREVGAGRGGARPAAHAVSPAASACCVRRELSMRGRAALNVPFASTRSWRTESFRSDVGGAEAGVVFAAQRGPWVRVISGVSLLSRPV
ncbi:hypothetical protein EMIHUDRAFT_231258 [Emiliania huxleyi CCMP1516]|uniref:Uncharacterized protein n=2 Tax=Emiliania huxleyi TaxID=2903 RepID=A0A0D3K7V9_EMIH1|nr:hypothetical protein EMIHUDRAFT_231258 [Emiliania huxleyi CCMP1516]EOD31844.1 hypothetical protein EMIHUDRAFT_231258 [Emiliania huxleyi CCMP1516]|eukprot:XP_005784273.1 hypothetical protein EMIHUDRAFT_231258 [Emiliania huxleyi CCMP1516]